jgi:hypothetical protein
MGEPGYIYALTNESMPALFKIGKTTRTVEERVEEISRGTGVPTPFVIFTRQRVSDCTAAETMVHRYFGELGKRENARREFFRVTSSEVLHIFERVAKAYPYDPRTHSAPTAQSAERIHVRDSAPTRVISGTVLSGSARQPSRPVRLPRSLRRAVVLGALSVCGWLYVQASNSRIDLPWRRLLPINTAVVPAPTAATATPAVAAALRAPDNAMDADQTGTKVPLSLPQLAESASAFEPLDQHDRAARAQALVKPPATPQAAAAQPKPTRTPRAVATKAVQPESTRTAAPTTVPAAKPAAGYARGERIPMGEYAITVIDVEEAGSSYTSTYALPAGKKLVAVKVRIETNEWQVFHTVASQRTSLSAGGRRYELAKYGAKSPSFNDPFDADGKDDTGWLTFEVDTAASGFVLSYGTIKSGVVTIAIGD